MIDETHPITKGLHSVKGLLTSANEAQFLHIEARIVVAEAVLVGVMDRPSRAK